MPEWNPDVELDEAHVRRLLGGQFPDLALDGLRPFAAGWDNALWAVGDDVVFRFPRRAIAVPGVERELAVLPRLRPRLPLAIPLPAWIGHPAGDYPWPFFGARLLPGREIAEASLDGARTAFGADLGRFLRALHDPALAEELGAGLPRDPMGRADMAVRVPRTRDRLRRLADAGLWAATPPVERILDAAVDMPHSDGLVLAHGDLHVRHVLVGEDGHPTGVIDWGDLCVGDPSIDLSLYWSVLDPPGRHALREAYGPIRAGGLLRARVLALFLNAALALYAADVGNPGLLAESIRGLERTLIDG